MSTVRNQNGDIPKTPAVFKHEGRIYFLIAMLAINSLFFFMGFVQMTTRHGPVTVDEIVLFAQLFFFFLLGVGTVMGQSDIVVDNLGISKRILGWTWRTIRWDNVRVIKIFIWLNPIRKKTVRVITIYPSTRSQFKLFRTGGIRFMDELVNMNNLIEIMNHYITQYKIKIESTMDNGVTTSPSHL